MASPLELRLAYLHLYRAGLHAVQFSKPARFALRDRLRSAFRSADGTFDALRVRQTVYFFNAAAAERGIEHRIVKNLLRVHWTRRQLEKPVSYKSSLAMAQARTKRENDHPAKSSKKDTHDASKENAFVCYERTIAMLNDSMGLCLQ